MINNKPELKKRLVHIDFIKGWAIFLIVLFHQHNPFSTTFTAWFIGRGYEVPIFFILAGFFLKDELLIHPYKFIKKKINQLYIPTTIIYITTTLLHNIFAKYNFSISKYYHIESTYDSLKKIVFSIFCIDSGELLMGAMWFVYSLLYSFFCLSIIAWLTNKITQNKKHRNTIITTILLIAIIISQYLTENTTILNTKICVLMSASFLIWWGKIINQELKWNYKNPTFFIIAFILFSESIITARIHPYLAVNKYQDVISLIVTSSCALYIWGFIGLKIEHTLIGKIITRLGQESFYIMAFHILGFFICNFIFISIGVYHLEDPCGLYTFGIFHWWQAVIYTIIGCCLPLLIHYFICLLQRFINEALNRYHQL